MRIALALVVVSLAWHQPAELRITLVGNAGVMLSDGDTSLIVDLPYDSGAFGYQTWRPDALQPPGQAVSVITHHHRDHFDATLFEKNPTWRLIGPPSVTSQVSGSRVLSGDTVKVGAFEVVVVPTPHTDDHRSYRIHWGGRVFYFVGDTEDPSALEDGPPRDVLFITPWLSCAADKAGIRNLAARSIAYHLRAGNVDRICGQVERLDQGTSFTVAPR